MNRILMIPVLLCVIFLASCKSKEIKEEEQTENLVTSPLRKDTSILEDYVGQVRSIQHIELRALEGGYLEHIYVDEGQMVQKGQLMFEIMPKIYEAEVSKAKAEVDYAEIEYKNTKSLADSDVVSQNELALSSAQFQKAQAEYQLAKVHLSFTKIKAPFTGIMDRFNVRLGSLLEDGELLTSLSDNSKMWVYFNVPESQYLLYKKEVKKDSIIPVRLKMANGEMFEHDGRVETIEADFNNETGNISFRATFPNEEGLLRYGETGTIQMVTPLNNALLIPQKATFEVLDKKYVFVVDDKNVIHTREVTIQDEMSDIYVISKGLETTDRIVLNGLRKVEEGQEIDPEFVEPEEALNNLQLYSE